MNFNLELQDRKTWSFVFVVGVKGDPSPPSTKKIEGNRTGGSGEKHWQITDAIYDRLVLGCQYKF